MGGAEEEAECTLSCREQVHNVSHRRILDFIECFYYTSPGMVLASLFARTLERTTMDAFTIPAANTRLGIHYFSDSRHYGESDLKTWLPHLKSLGISWLALVAPNDRAIPETFLTGLIEAGIEPVLHFELPLLFPALTDNLELLLHAYAKWGVHYVVFFDRPNTRLAWPANTWAQSDLVERFLDLYLPLADTALSAGLTPVFPPLEPGGDYWDTAFLRAALQGIQRRGHAPLLRSLVLSAYAGVDDRPLNWGAGGPERWPGARPYFTPPGQQDQRGFYIFDWYLALTKAILGDSRPLMLLGAGSRLAAGLNATEEQLEIHARENFTLARLVSGEASSHGGPLSGKLVGTNETDPLDPVPSEVLSCCFWLLTAEQDDPQAGQAWFQPDGSPLPVVIALREGAYHPPSNTLTTTAALEKWVFTKNLSMLVEEDSGSPAGQDHPIAHYLLLPIYEWGITDWHLEAIRPFIKRHRPTVGFSLEEASHAARVTVIGNQQIFTDEALETLARSGCQVDRIAGDGTSIATQLATR
jgi:hypothetical protein